MEQSKGFIMAKSQLSLTEPFFTVLLYDLEAIPTDEIPYAATDGYRLLYNPETFDQFTLQERMGVLAHEILHGVFMHITRRGSRNPERWNIAADYVVNYHLKEHGITLPEFALYDPKYDSTWTVERVYDDLPTSVPSGDGIGDSDSSRLPKNEMADIMEPEKNKSGKSVKEIEAEMKNRLAKAHEMAKATGNTSSALDRMVGTLMVDKLPWYSILRKWYQSLTIAEYNWARIDRRRTVMLGGILAPALFSESLEDAVITVDCSGSMTKKELASISTHVSNMLNECKPKKATIIYFDSAICKVQDFTGPYYNIKLELVGGGGTNFTIVADYINKNVNAAFVVWFSDLRGTANIETFAPSIWVTSSKNTGVKAPYGELIFADYND